jgi:hypothetical protein
MFKKKRVRVVSFAIILSLCFAVGFTAQARGDVDGCNRINVTCTY